MRSVVLGLAATLLAGGAAFAQSTTATTTPGPSTSTTPAHSPMSGASANPATSGTPAVSSDRSSASGNDNQAVASTNANATTPAHGHNSFTRGQARHRIASEGYSHVTGLRLVGGVWRGQATKDGQTTGVWLDYKGNVGAAQS